MDAFNGQEMPEEPFLAEDYLILRALLAGHYICDRYYLQGLYDGVYDRPLLCESGYVDKNPQIQYPEAYRWITTALEHKWRGSQLKELGLLEYVRVVEIKESKRTVENTNYTGFGGFRMTDAPKYLYYLYRLSPQGRVAAEKIVKAHFGG
jgi:hypothetical protein